MNFREWIILDDITQELWLYNCLNEARKYTRIHPKQYTKNVAYYNQAVKSPMFSRADKLLKPESNPKLAKGTKLTKEEDFEHQLKTGLGRAGLNDNEAKQGQFVLKSGFVVQPDHPGVDEEWRRAMTEEYQKQNEWLAQNKKRRPSDKYTPAEQWGLEQEDYTQRIHKIAQILAGRLSPTPGTKEENIWKKQQEILRHKERYPDLYDPRPWLPQTGAAAVQGSRLQPSFPAIQQQLISLGIDPEKQSYSWTHRELEEE